jgi:hypothetical protein
MYFGEPLVLYVGKQPIKHLKWDMSVPVTGPIYSNIVLGTTTGFLLLTVSPKVSSSLEKYCYNWIKSLSTANCHKDITYSGMDVSLLVLLGLPSSSNPDWCSLAVAYPCKFAVSLSN